MVLIKSMCMFVSFLSFPSSFFFLTYSKKSKSSLVGANVHSAYPAANKQTPKGIYDRFAFQPVSANNQHETKGGSGVVVVVLSFYPQSFTSNLPIATGKGKLMSDATCGKPTRRNDGFQITQKHAA